MEALGRILIADDENVFLDSTADLLIEEGYCCDCVGVRMIFSKTEDGTARIEFASRGIGYCSWVKEETEAPGIRLGCHGRKGARTGRWWTRGN